MSDELVISEPEGTISVPAPTLARLVARAAERVDGARVRRPRRSIEVDVSGGSATIALRLAARYGSVLPSLAEAVQREIADALAAMCELDVRQVDVAIEELV